MKPGTILDDKRQIMALHMGETSIKREVGGFIQAYLEGGEMGYVTWFAVWRNRDNEEPTCRVNGKFVHLVEY